MAVLALWFGANAATALASVPIAPPGGTGWVKNFEKYDGEYQFLRYWFENGERKGFSTEAEWEDMTRFLSGVEYDAGGTGQTAANMYGEEAAAKAAEIEAAAVGDAAAEGEIVGMAAEAGTLPALSSLGTIAAPALALGSAGYLGWTVGSTLRDLFNPAKGTEAPVAGVMKFAGQEYPKTSEPLISTEDKNNKKYTVAVPHNAAVDLFSESGETSGAVSLLHKWRECLGKRNSPNWTNSTDTLDAAVPSRAKVLSTPWMPIVGTPLKEGAVCERTMGKAVEKLQAQNIKGGFSGQVNKTGTVPSAITPVTAEETASAALEGSGQNSDENGNRFPHMVGILGGLAAGWGMLHHGGEGIEGESTIPTPETGETYQHYDERLEELHLNPHPQVLPENYADPAKGPSEVVSTEPEIGTKVKVDSDVSVRYNPADVPAPSSGGGWSPPGIHSIDMSPFQGFSPCGVFPFGVLCWFGQVVGMFDVTPSCPTWSPVFPIAGKEELDICAPPVPTVVGILRPIILFSWVLSLGFLFARMSKGVGED